MGEQAETRSVADGEAGVGPACPRCGESVVAGLRYCPRCGEQLTAGAPAASPPTAAAAVPSKRAIEADLPLLTGGATILATGAGLRGELPTLGLALIAIGALVMLAPAAFLVRAAAAAGPVAAATRVRRTTVLALAALLGGLLLGGVLAGLLWPRLRGEPPPPPLAALSCDELTADAVVARFVVAGLPVEPVGAPPAGLGNPTTVAAFRDTRLSPPERSVALPPERLAAAIVAGGIVATYPTAAAAEAAAALPPPPRVADPERRARRGPVLLSLSGRLTTEQAAEYEAALATTIGCAG